MFFINKSHTVQYSYKYYVYNEQCQPCISLKVYFEELAISARVDTLTSMMTSHHVSPCNRLQTMAAGSSPVDASPTDLSMRKDRSASFTSPSSGFDSPSMHCSGHVGSGGDVTRVGRHGNKSLLSDGVDADRSTSLTISRESRDQSPPIVEHDADHEVRFNAVIF